MALPDIVSERWQEGLPYLTSTSLCCFHSALTLLQTSAALSRPLSQASIPHETAEAL